MAYVHRGILLLAFIKLLSTVSGENQIKVVEHSEPGSPRVIKFSLECEDDPDPLVSMPSENEPLILDPEVDKPLKLHTLPKIKLPKPLPLIKKSITLDPLKIDKEALMLKLDALKERQSYKPEIKPFKINKDLLKFKNSKPIKYPMFQSKLPIELHHLKAEAASPKVSALPVEMECLTDRIRNSLNQSPVHGKLMELLQPKIILQTADDPRDVASESESMYTAASENRKITSHDDLTSLETQTLSKAKSLAEKLRKSLDESSKKLRKSLQLYSAHEENDPQVGASEPERVSDAGIGYNKVGEDKKLFPGSKLLKHEIKPLKINEDILKLKKPLIKDPMFRSNLPALGQLGSLKAEVVFPKVDFSTNEGESLVKKIRNSLHQSPIHEKLTQKLHSKLLPQNVEDPTVDASEPEIVTESKNGFSQYKAAPSERHMLSEAKTLVEKLRKTLERSTKKLKKVLQRPPVEEESDPQIGASEPEIVIDSKATGANMLSDEAKSIIDTLKKSVDKSSKNGRFMRMLRSKLSSQNENDSKASGSETNSFDTSKNEERSADEEETGESNYSPIVQIPPPNVININKSKTCDLCKCILAAFPKKVEEGQFIMNDPSNDLISRASKNIPRGSFRKPLLLSKLYNEKLPLNPKLRSSLNIPSNLEQRGDQSTMADEQNPSFALPPNVEDDSELSNLERAARTEQGLKRLLEFVNIVDQVDHYISTKTRRAISRLATIFEEDDNARIL